jgi:putative flippase GtrA
VNTVLSYAIYCLLVGLGAGLGWASLGSLAAGLASGYAANRSIVFGGGGRWALARFLAVWSLLYCVFLLIVIAVRKAGMSDYVGGLAAVPVTAVLSYQLQSRYVFSEKAPNGTRVDAESTDD